MPSSHRRYAEWTPARMMREARKIGPATIALVQAVMKAKPHPEQGFHACIGILRLARGYGTARVEAACRRGNDIGAATYGSIASILKNGLDKAYAREPTPETPPIRHADGSNPLMRHGLGANSGRVWEPGRPEKCADNRQYSIRSVVRME
jgi:transposase